MKRTSFFGMAALLLILSASTLQAQVPLPDVAHFRFDEIGDTLVNAVAGGSNATWFGGTGNNVSAAGIIGGGSQTNDENGGNGQEHYRVDLNLLDGATSMTISLWFNTNVDDNNNSNYNGLFTTRDMTSTLGSGSGENWGLALENNNSPRHIDWRLNGVPGMETDNIEGNTTDQWRHVAFVWDGVTGSRRLYQDGALIHDEMAPTGNIIDGGTWRIGDDACCNSREFTGTMDDIAVWKQAFSDAQVLELYNDGLMGIDAAGVIPPKMGDVDLDDDTDLVDFETIRANLFRDFGGAAVTRADGDLNGDGAVNFVDYREWKTEYDSENQPASFAVPEPASIAILLLGMVGVGASRRRG